MLKIENLRKVFRTDEIETIALDNVSFAIEKGEFVAVMGPSGCGKSTLLNILGLLDNPTSGSYTLLGQEVSAFREKDRTLFRKGNIGFVFQSFNLIDELNVFENVELPLIYLRVKASERRRRVTEILNRMNISHRAKHFPQQLSGGQQQRGHRQPAAHTGRRADRKPRFEKRTGGNGTSFGTEPRRDNDHHGHPLAARFDLRPPGTAPLRRYAGQGPDEQTLNAAARNAVENLTTRRPQATELLAVFGVPRTRTNSCK